MKFQSSRYGDAASALVPVFLAGPTDTLEPAFKDDSNKGVQLSSY